ncbi:MAG: hypothetical protein COB02_09400 [Candidatus Cloacimonadota bacterium]|nr:MAG: hypothetical protein COB02_09400 [Candidatus Cloacimonadota bacterium]
MIRPWRITIDTNPDHCNLNCIMCDTHSIYNKDFKPTRKIMEKVLLNKVIDEALALGVKEIIPTTMGEPLLYKHFDIFISKLINNKTKLNLTTNGTFPTIGVEKWAKKLLPVLSDIKISINSIDSKINESIMVNDSTLKKLNDIKKFTKIRDALYPKVSITLQVTFLDSNLNYLEEIINFSIENNINRVKGHHLWVTYKEIKSESLQNSNIKIEKWNSFIDNINKYKTLIKLVNFEKQVSKKDIDLVPEAYNCPFLSNEIWIDYNGDFNVCCAPSKIRLSLGKWGSIKSRTIENMFNSIEYSNLIKNYKNQKICTICSLRKSDD